MTLRQDFVPSRDVAMKLVEDCATQVASSDETVLILGETGVGKDVMARRIHETSPRSGGRFVHINCAAVSEGLLESELFGHVRGAYTGAVDSQAGQFELASGGTLFLDEIGEMNPRHQAKLLHVLQNRQFCRVGGRVTIEADVRVIAATNQDLDEAMAHGRFRRDLYYRLGVVCLRIPPLRERPEDLEVLTHFFAAKYASLYNRPQMARPGTDVLDRLRRHHFEGNVRELENLIKRAILLGSFGEILREIDHRDDAMAEPMERVAVEEPPFFAQTETQPLKEVARKATERAERHAINQALDAAGWNRRRAAEMLEISYRSLLYKIRDYAITKRRPDLSSDSRRDPSEPTLMVDGDRIYSFREGSA